MLPTYKCCKDLFTPPLKKMIYFFLAGISRYSSDSSTIREGVLGRAEYVFGWEQSWCHRVHASFSALLGYMASIFDSLRKTRPSSPTYLPRLFHHKFLGCSFHCPDFGWDRRKRTRKANIFHSACLGKFLSYFWEGGTVLRILCLYRDFNYRIVE